MGKKSSIFVITKFPEFDPGEVILRVTLTEVAHSCKYSYN